MSEALHKEILKLLSEGPMMPGTIRNILNGSGWDVGQIDVNSVLHSLQRREQVVPDDSGRWRLLPP
jgi:hypothetical protein